MRLVELEGEALTDVQPSPRWRREHVLECCSRREEDRAAMRSHVALEQSLVSEVHVAAVHLNRAAAVICPVVREVRAHRRHVGAVLDEHGCTSRRVAIPNRALHQCEACRVDQDRARGVAAQRRPRKEGAAADDGERPLHNWHDEAALRPAIARACNSHLEAAL